MTGENWLLSARIKGEEVSCEEEAVEREEEWEGSLAFGGVDKVSASSHVV
jgi:hypothetical protein